MNHHQNINAIFSTEHFILYLKKPKKITKQVKQFKQSQTDFKINLKKNVFAIYVA
jgi:hypothetical protein